MSDAGGRKSDKSWHFLHRLPSPGSTAQPYRALGVHWGRFPVHPVYLKLQQQPKHSLYLTARVTPLSPSGDTAGSYDVMENRSPNPLRMFSITWQRFSHAWERFFPVMISVAVHEVLPDT